MLLNSAVARAITARSSALRARSRSSSQALRCARAALASSSPSAVALKSTLRPSPGSRGQEGLRKSFHWWTRSPIVHLSD